MIRAILCIAAIVAIYVLAAKFLMQTAVEQAKELQQHGDIVNGFMWHEDGYWVKDGKKFIPGKKTDTAQEWTIEPFHIWHERGQYWTDENGEPYDAPPPPPEGWDTDPGWEAQTELRDGVLYVSPAPKAQEEYRKQRLNELQKQWDLLLKHRDKARTWGQADMIDEQIMVIQKEWLELGAER